MFAVEAPATRLSCAALGGSSERQVVGAGGAVAGARRRGRRRGRLRRGGRCGGRRACGGRLAAAVAGRAVLAVALEEHLARLDGDGLAVLALLVVPFAPLELAALDGVRRRRNGGRAWRSASVARIRAVGGRWRVGRAAAFGTGDCAGPVVSASVGSGGERGWGEAARRGVGGLEGRRGGKAAGRRRPGERPGGAERQMVGFDLRFLIHGEPLLQDGSVCASGTTPPMRDVQEARTRHARLLSVVHSERVQWRHFMAADHGTRCRADVLELAAGRLLAWR